MEHSPHESAGTGHVHVGAALAGAAIGKQPRRGPFGIALGPHVAVQGGRTWALGMQCCIEHFAGALVQRPAASSSCVTINTSRARLQMRSLARMRSAPHTTRNRQHPSHWCAVLLALDSGSGPNWSVNATRESYLLRNSAPFRPWLLASQSVHLHLSRSWHSDSA